MTGDRFSSLVTTLLLVGVSFPAANADHAMSTVRLDFDAAADAPADPHPGGPIMSQNKNPSDLRHLFGEQPGRFGSMEPDEEMLRLERELRWRKLLHDPDVQWLVDKAVSCSGQNRQWARDQLRLMLEGNRIMDMRTADPYRPHGPPQLLSSGEIHLLDQVDGTAWKILRAALTRGLLVTGPQGGGKTRFIIWLCRQLNAANPPIPWFLIDPKLEFKGWAESLGAIYIDAENPRVSLDLGHPPDLIYETWLPPLMSYLGEIVGAVYGIEILQQAAEICMGLRRQFLQQNRNTEISLADIYAAVPFVPNTSNYRRAGYRDAVQTGISRILTGSGNLFKCRQGIRLAGLFDRNVILGTRSIVDSFATRFLAFYLLWFQQESERHLPPTSEPKSMLIIDDASRYISGTEGFGSKRLSSLGSVLTTLRSSGRCFCAVTQVPHLMDPSVSALLHTVVNIGGLHHNADTQLLAKQMGLTEAQRLALMSLAQREAVGLCGGSAWPHPVHGQVPEVPDLINPSPPRAVDLPQLRTEPYRSLFEVVTTGKPAVEQKRPADAVESKPAAASKADAHTPPEGLTTAEHVFALDVVTFLTSPLRERQQRLSFSVRQLEKVKRDLLNKSLIKEVWLGKHLMIAPTRELFVLLGIDGPYRRDRWDTHSYLVVLGAALIEPYPLVKYVKTEVSIGDANATVDLIAYLKDGSRWAYEVVHRSITNVAALAARLQGKGFAEVCFLCTEFAVKEKVHAQIRNAGFDPDFRATIRYRIFSSLLRRRKQMGVN